MSDILHLSPRDAQNEEGDIVPVDDVPEARDLPVLMPDIPKPEGKIPFKMSEAARSALGLSNIKPDVEPGTEALEEAREEQEQFGRFLSVKRKLNDALDASLKEGLEVPEIIDNGARMTVKEFIDTRLDSIPGLKDEDRETVRVDYTAFAEGYDVKIGWTPQAKRKAAQRAERYAKRGKRAAPPPPDGFIDGKSRGAGE